MSFPRLLDGFLLRPSVSRLPSTLKHPLPLLLPTPPRDSHLLQIEQDTLARRSRKAGCAGAMPNPRLHPAIWCNARGTCGLTHVQPQHVSAHQRKVNKIPCPLGLKSLGPAMTSSGAFSRHTKNTVRPSASTVKRKVMSSFLRKRIRRPSVLLHPKMSNLSVFKSGFCASVAFTAGSMG